MDIRKEFSKIYDQNINRIYRFNFLKVSSKEIAQDLTSEAFTRAWSSFAKATEDKTKVLNWTAFLYQIARNLVIDHYREKGQFQIVSAAYVADPAINLEEKAILSSDAQQIKEAIKDLGQEQQEVVLMRHVEGLSFKEIGEILGKPEGTVRVISHRAIESLKIALSKEKA